MTYLLPTARFIMIHYDYLLLRSSRIENITLQYVSDAFIIFKKCYILLY